MESVTQNALFVSDYTGPSGPGFFMQSASFDLIVKKVAKRADKKTIRAAELQLIFNLKPVDACRQTGTDGAALKRLVDRIKDAYETCLDVCTYEKNAPNRG